MSFKTDEISAIIKDQIRNFKNKNKMDEEGTVISVGDGIALIYGLKNAILGELLEFANGIYGMILNLEEDAVGVVLMGDDVSIKEGDKVKRTNKIVETPVGNNMLGRVVNALGQPIDGKKPIISSKFRPVERIAPGVMSRQSVSEPLETGIMTIDTMIPIGKGQRELIIGDRQTGKTAIAIDTIINQKNKDVYCIYVAIGQKNSTIAQIVEKLKDKDCLDYIVIVSASASENAPLQYLAPYTGTAIAEEWMENGKNVLIIYDDLSKHAVAYRTMSLLLRRPPGREAYPGDVFYLHSRLLERAARLNTKHGGGSITALPIVETQAGDISAYIPTNVISITDGQIFLMTDLFNAGQRPAIDSGLSVSRVGSSAQIKAIKKLSGDLKLKFAQYSELQSFAQFGADLDEETKKILHYGEIVTEVFKQPQYDPIDQINQVLILFTIKYQYIIWVPIDYIEKYRSSLFEYFHSKQHAIWKTIRDNKDVDDSFVEKMKKICENFTIKFISKIPNYDYKAIINKNNAKD